MDVAIRCNKEAASPIAGLRLEHAHPTVNRRGAQTCPAPWAFAHARGEDRPAGVLPGAVDLAAAQHIEQCVVDADRQIARLRAKHRATPARYCRSAARCWLPSDASLRKHAQELEQDCNCRHTRHAAGIERRRDLDEIRADKIEAAQFAYQALDFEVVRPPGSGVQFPRIGRVEQVDVEREVRGTLAYNHARLLGCPSPSLVVKLLDRNHAHTPVMAELPHISLVQGATNADLDRALRIDEPLFDRPAKRRAVMEARAEIVIARVAIGIDVHQAERSIPGNCAQNRKRDRMVAADDNGVTPAAWTVAKKALISA